MVRQDPQETFAPLGELVAKVLLYGLARAGRALGNGSRWQRDGSPGRFSCCTTACRKSAAVGLDRRLELKTGDEIEGLADAFNQMAANLQRSFGQIEQRMGDVRPLEEKYRDLIEHSPEMIYQLDRSGRFVHVNKTGLDKLGYQPR